MIITRTVHPSLASVHLFFNSIPIQHILLRITIFFPFRIDHWYMWTDTRYLYQRPSDFIHPTIPVVNTSQKLHAHRSVRTTSTLMRGVPFNGWQHDVHEAPSRGLTYAARCNAASPQEERKELAHDFFRTSPSAVLPSAPLRCSGRVQLCRNSRVVFSHYMANYGHLIVFELHMYKC